MKTISWSAFLCMFLVGAWLPLRLSAGQLANPTVTVSATPFNDSYVAQNLFDAGVAEYASRSQGAVSAGFTTNPADGTWVELDFGATVTFDQFVMATRRNAVDVVGVSRLIVSADPVFDDTDTIFTFDPSGSNGSGILRNLGSVSGRYVRWEALTSTGPGLNLGGSQMYFLDAAAGNARLPAPAVINSYPAFNANYDAAFAVNGDAGYEVGHEYATAGGGAAMFIDFDFGASVPISGFDYWNRWSDRVTTFDLIFSDTPSFSELIDVLSFAADSNGNQVCSGTFLPVHARYVRFQATGYAGTANTGVREIQFFTPSGQPPAILQAPQGAMRLVGDPVTFTVEALGENLTYQWWKDPTAIEGATNASLVLTNLQLADNGAYSVVVSNPFGSVTSDPVVLTVIDPPPVDISSDMRLWFKFDETTSLVAIDDSGNANDGTLNGFVGDDSQWVPGRIGNALSFGIPDGGSNRVVTVPDFGFYDFATTGEFTLAAWVKGNPLQLDGAGLIAKGTGAGGEQFALDVYGGAYRFFGRGTGGSPVFMAQGTTGPNAAWQHVVGVYSRQLNRLKLYVNGAEVASSTPLPGDLQATTHDVSVGARRLSTNDYDLTFNGLMDDVRIYARAFTPADVLELCNQAPAAPPVVELQPRGFYLLVGGAWVFSAGVSGSIPISYQWTRDGTPIPDATNLTYEVMSAQVSDTGDYALVVTNLYGAASSASARLAVVPSLDLRTAPVQASSQWSADYAPANAFDGLRLSTGPNTARWASASQFAQQWIYVDLGQDMPIQHVLLDWENAAGGDMKLRARTEAEGPSANPDDWREVASVTGYVPVGNGLDGADMVFDFGQRRAVLQGNTSPSAFASIASGGLNARYLMVHALATIPPFGHFSLWEMDVNPDTRPRLTIEQSGSELLIGWPAAVTGFDLEETDSLPAGIWRLVPGVENNTVVINADGMKFFRLKRQ